VLTHDEVVWGYRYILGRDPESEAVVRAHATAARDVPTFRRILLQCPEFDRISIQSLSSRFQESLWVAAPVCGGARMMWIDLRDRYVSLGCLQDGYEVVESRFIRGVLREGDVFVDVGANVGWYTMLASTIVGERGHIHAFEPRRPIVDYLQRTVELNRLENMVTVHPIGLSNEATSELLMWGATSDNGGGASLSRNDAGPDMVCQSIEVRRLDSLALDHVDVIKIDVEGAEFLVMAGAKDTVTRHRPIVLSEVLPEQLTRVSGCSPQDYFDFFSHNNYDSYIVDHDRCGERVDGYPSRWDKGLVNIAFIPTERTIDASVFHLTSPV
jgi:FkbM family methyltransferase